MKTLNNLYQILVCNKFNYLFIQILLIILVLTLGSYDTSENKWGVVYILRICLILLYLAMIFRFVFLHFSPVFIIFLFIISIISIFYNEIINLLGQFKVSNTVAEFAIQYHAESVITISLSILLVISLTSQQKELVHK